MNIKALIEKKNELKAEYRALYEQAVAEKRSLDGDAREAELSAEIADLNAQIKEEEARAAQEADTVENIESEKEKREMEKQLTQEQEVRALEQFIRKTGGEELRSMEAGSEPGKIVVPTHLSNVIIEKLSENAPIFARTRNFTPVNGFLDILREDNMGTAGFVGEMKELEKSDFSLNKVTLSQKRVGTAIELSQHLVNDSGIDIVGYATRILGRRLGLTIDSSILTGQKDTEFEGILNDTVVLKPQIALSDKAITIDELLDLYNSMNPAYIGGAVWVVGRLTFNMIAKLKDNNGHYFLVREVSENGPIYKLFGQPVVINDTMPAPEAGEKAVVFANFSEGYATMTKKGFNFQHISGDTTQAMRGSHLLLLDGYMDGKILNPPAIKILQMKTV